MRVLAVLLAGADKIPVGVSSEVGLREQETLSTKAAQTLSGCVEDAGCVLKGSLLVSHL